MREQGGRGGGRGAQEGGDAEEGERGHDGQLRHVAADPCEELEVGEDLSGSFGASDSLDVSRYARDVTW